MRFPRLEMYGAGGCGLGVRTRLALCAEAEVNEHACGEDNVRDDFDLCEEVFEAAGLRGNGVGSRCERDRGVGRGVPWRLCLRRYLRWPALGEVNVSAEGSGGERWWGYSLDSKTK